MNRIRQNKKDLITRKLCFTAMCFALCMTLPFLTGNLAEFGKLLCPMHLPVLLCGAACGAVWGGALGLVAPIIRSLAVGAPVLFPMAISMSVELFFYGFVMGIFVKIFKKNTLNVYISLLISMICGRIAGGAFKVLLLTFGAISDYGWQIFFTGYFVETLPGAVLQLIVIPPAIYAIRKHRLIP